VLVVGELPQTAVVGVPEADLSRGRREVRSSDLDVHLRLRPEVQQPRPGLWVPALGRDDDVAVIVLGVDERIGAGLTGLATRGAQHQTWDAEHAVTDQSVGVLIDGGVDPQERSKDTFIDRHERRHYACNDRPADPSAVSVSRASARVDKAEARWSL